MGKMDLKIYCIACSVKSSPCLPPVCVDQPYKGWIQPLGQQLTTWFGNYNKEKGQDGLKQPPLALHSHVGRFFSSRVLLLDAWTSGFLVLVLLRLVYW